MNLFNSIDGLCYTRQVAYRAEIPAVELGLH